jgi:hypothetical protein
MATRNELVKAHYQEYQKADKKRKGAILDELTEVAGWNRDYLATRLTNYTEKVSMTMEGVPVKLKAVRSRKSRAEGKRGGRPVVYKADFVKVLTDVWADHGQMCGKLLVPAIKGMIDFLETDSEYGITAEIRALLVKVSPAEADILLKPAKKSLEVKGISTTRAASASLRSQVPVQTHFDRKTVKPGDFAFDTVANCGGSASGQFCKTLTGTDVYSGWIEERALLNAANRWVQEAMTEIKASLPFPMKSAHYDNGMEFINKPLLDWCIEQNIRTTRSRPYKKNDNCYVEQKNYDAVRKTVGYFRFDTPGECEAMAEVYRYLCPLYNYWYPSFKLLEKEKQADGRYKKVYEKEPKTPYQRLVESPDVSDECKAELERRKAGQNPVELNRLLNEAVDRLLKINREKSIIEESPEGEVVQTLPVAA